MPKTSDAFHITYTTFFDVTELDANNPALDHYRNTSAIDWTDEARETIIIQKIVNRLNLYLLLI